MGRAASSEKSARPRGESGPAGGENQIEPLPVNPLHQGPDDRFLIIGNHLVALHIPLNTNQIHA